MPFAYHSLQFSNNQPVQPSVETTVEPAPGHKPLALSAQQLH